MMPQSPLALSSSHRASLMHFGEEAQPMLVVDDTLADLDLVRAIAAKHSYHPIGPFYPGVRAAVSEKVAMPLAEPLLPQIQEAFELANEPAYVECFLSLVTKLPGELAPIQRLPHFDGTEPSRIAVLLYLSDDREGGTAFYRQVATGFESIDAARYETYLAKLESGIQSHGIPPASYIGSDSPMFARTMKIDAVANRMIVYRGNALHCAAMTEGFAPSDDPSTGRLTLNLFLKA